MELIADGNFSSVYRFGDKALKITEDEVTMAFYEEVEKLWVPGLPQVKKVGDGYIMPLYSKAILPPAKEKAWKKLSDQLYDRLLEESRSNEGPFFEMTEMDLLYHEIQHIKAFFPVNQEAAEKLFYIATQIDKKFPKWRSDLNPYRGRDNIMWDEENKVVVFTDPFFC